MSERIYKLQPDRTLALRGFDDLGAAAALHSATPTGFKVSGVFRDPADFAVLMLWDADNFYEHPRLKYLPDFDFAGLTLSFDVHYSGLMPLESPKYPTIDWPWLDAVRPDGTTARVRLSDHAEPVGAPPTAASCTFEVQDNGILGYDRLTLWYGNLAFDYFAPPEGASATAVAHALAAAINGTNWTAAGALIPLTAVAVGPILTITADVPGEDGNMLAMYATWKNERLRTSAAVAHFSGGSSDVTWRVTLDFAALNLTQIRAMWLTFAPALANACAFSTTEWEAAFTNWSVTGAEETRRLRIAGPDSVRVEENDSWCSWTGAWTQEQGFYSGGYARVADSNACRLRVRYACNATHELWLGTSLRNDGGVIGWSLDGGAGGSGALSCALPVDAPVNTRRQLQTSVPPGEHVLEITACVGFRFDFLEAVVPSDVPAPLSANLHLSPALDYSTDHTYKLPPARIHWIFDQLGFAGPMNEYIGVFWWNQRKVVGAEMPEVRITFDNEFCEGDAIFLKVGAAPAQLIYGKSVFPADTNATIARHFALFLNGSSVGVWAEAAGNVLTIRSRSARPAYRIPFVAELVPTTGSTGTIAVEGSLESGASGQWVVDPDQTPTLNRAARDWHADFFAECARRGRRIAVAESMELVNPPAGFAAQFASGAPVETEIGFASLKSTHCNFGTGMRAYQTAVLSNIAALQAAAGLTPELQLGEFVWWFFADGGMAYYDVETKAAAESTLGRPLALFSTPNDDPGAVNSGADARFLRSRLHQHVAAIIAGVRAAHPTAVFEVLFPYDVNYPTPAGVHHLGGRLNRFVNLPAEWERKETAGFDILKTEALDFGAWSRDLDLSRAAIELPRKLGWPRDSIRHLVPIFRPGYPWQKEVEIALRECVNVNLWAWDHICLFGDDVSTTKPSGARSALLGT